MKAAKKDAFRPHGGVDDGRMNANVEKAVRHALDILAKQRAANCGSDPEMQAHSFLIEGYQRMKGDLPGDILSMIGEVFLRYGLKPDKLARLMAAVRKARETNVRRDVLTAYISTSLLLGRFPYVREIREWFKSGRRFAGSAPEERIIRRICDELDLPRTTKPGRPKN
jgi:hypothetical protein